MDALRALLGKKMMSLGWSMGSGSLPVEHLLHIDLGYRAFIANSTNDAQVVIFGFKGDTTAERCCFQ